MSGERSAPPDRIELLHPDPVEFSETKCLEDDFERALRTVESGCEMASNRVSLPPWFCDRRSHFDLDQNKRALFI